MGNTVIQGKSTADRTIPIEIKVDPTSGGIITTTDIHARVHGGLLFSLSGIITGITSGSTSYFHGLTDGRAVHFWAGVVSVGNTPCSINFYEGATLSDNGTPLTARNRKRSSTLTPTLQTFSAPTVTDTGTLLESALIPSTSPGQGGGDAQLFATEWVLDVHNTSYLIGLTNNSGQTISASYNFLWYED